MREIKFRAWSEKYNRLYGHGMYRVWEISIGKDGSLSGNVDETPIAGNKRDGYIPRVYFDKNRKGGGLATQDDDVFILMQYTGLKDRTGTEIYEGDILELINEGGERVKAVCKFGNRRLTTEDGVTIDIQCFYFQIGDKKTNPVVVNYRGIHDLEIMEVRGNVYENPELLEVEK